MLPRNGHQGHPRVVTAKPWYGDSAARPRIASWLQAHAQQLRYKATSRSTCGARGQIKPQRAATVGHNARTDLAAAVE
ncbi:hypothetical protein SLA2020_275590 [Shorea laevis]